MKVTDIRKVAIIGSGLMGHGIAQEFAVAGYQARIHDLTEEKLQQAIQNMEANLRLLVDIGVLNLELSKSAMANIYTSTVLEDVLTDVDVVIEAVFEDLTLKQQIFKELDRLCPQRTILASNTSTFMPSKLATVTRRPDRVLVAHYFNPPYLLPLVELVTNPETSDETVATMYELMQKLGKHPAIVTKEATGFVANRLQAALLREALSIVDKGIASPADVDTVIKNSFGRRLAVAGVFELMDIAGVDLTMTATQHLQPDIESSSRISPMIEEKVRRGELGIKTGRGFYEWTPESANNLKKRIAEALVKMAQWS